jgi:uncharacterized protein (DUF983 family)
VADSTQWILKVGLRGRCPRCGKGRLFNGFLKLAPACDNCGLDFGFADPADGPAFFVMMTAAVPITAFALWLELSFDPPIWVHLVVTLPLLLIGCILPLRPLKATLVASQYVHNAEEGRLAGPRSDAGAHPVPEGGPDPGQGPNRPTAVEPGHPRTD